MMFQSVPGSESQRKPNFSCLYKATDVSHHLHVSSHYRWYGGFGLASMVLLVAVCAGLGLGLGLYAREGDAMPYERGRLSNCGGCCLVTQATCAYTLKYTHVRFNVHVASFVYVYKWISRQVPSIWFNCMSVHFKKIAFLLTFLVKYTHLSIHAHTYVQTHLISTNSTTHANSHPPSYTLTLSLTHYILMLLYDIRPNHGLNISSKK